MSEQKKYVMFCGDIYVADPNDEDGVGRMILSDHCGGKKCPDCMTNTLNELNALASRVAATDAMLSEFQLRLAGALIASEGGNGRPDDAIEAIKTCPTIKSVMDLRKDRDALASRVAAMEEALRGLLDAIHDNMTHEAQRHHADAIAAAKSALEGGGA